MLRVIAAVLFAAFPTLVSMARAEQSTPSYVGSQSCANCHVDAWSTWRNSHHALAWTTPDQVTVLGDFDDAVLDRNGTTTRFRRQNGQYIIETTEQDGTLSRHAVHSVAGVAPLQQYLVEIEKGRLQSHDLVWDVEKRRWYHLYPDQDLNPGDGLHWTGPYKNWNARCAECHATGFQRNYSPSTRDYASTQAEIGVGCEACHGPGEAHLGWARSPSAFDSAAWKSVTDKGFTIRFDDAASETEIQQCAGCHARREPLSDGNPLPGTAFHDAYRLALLRDGLYHADGSIRDEVYVYGSFLQSRMYRRGVRCSDCHEPHSATLKAEGNAVCTQCHSPAGNDRYPTLRRANYDDTSHHFHETASAGAECTSCHMIERTYMGIDPRRDHSFRVPRPDLSGASGAPNACNDCHKNRDAAWAATELATRFPDSVHRRPHFAETFAAAREDPSGVVDLLIGIARDTEKANIVRASALDMLRPIADRFVASRTADLLGDKDVLVRSAAVSLQRGAPPVERAQRLVTVLNDPFLSVRITAGRALLDAPLSQLPVNVADALRGALAEWRTSLLAKADYPETHMAIGGAALVFRNTRAAEEAFREVARLDPQHAQAWTMVVRIELATGDINGARSTLDQALVANPTNEALISLRESLGASNE